MTIKTSRYEWSNGHKPRGYGLWAFEVGGEQVFFQGSYTTAKQAAIQHARSLGETTIQVLP